MNAAAHPKIKSMSPQFLVAEMSRSTEFYTKTLGFSISFIYENFYCELIKDGCSIHLKSGKPSAEERINRRKNEDLDLNFSVDNIEDAYKYIQKTDAEIIQPLRQMPYGREFYITDPDGYIIAFLEAG